ncbi:MAG TPA: histidine--tRNA ligase [Tepidisphaeraceae bacterium]|nr:histidine--tRNA ligase [Tepidisphaeraceae bacterium]
MSAKISAPKGILDILPAESWKWQAVERIAREIAAIYHFAEIRTPIFEHTELFHRGVGETSDVVAKETYTFEDRGGRSITLRPEGTAGVVRAAIEHNLVAQEGARVKVFYIGPNFRYERPQAGRLRQHHQFGAEAFGAADPEQDVECILLQMDFYARCGVKDLSLRLNTLGDRESKQRYRDALVAVLSPLAARLSEDSQRRLSSNPLRILDSKDPRDVETIQSVQLPGAFEYLSTVSRAHWDRVLQLLEQSGVKFAVDGTLVRGFDYYTNTLWEVTAGGLGAQNAIGGGGRYDNLVEQLGGRPTPGVGFGSGIERLLLALENQGVQLPRVEPKLIWLVSHGDDAKQANWKLMLGLRRAGFACDMDPSGRSVKSQFKVADREHAAYCLITGETELAAGTVVVKDLATSQQVTVPRDAVVEHLRSAGVAVRPF